MPAEAPAELKTEEERAIWKKVARACQEVNTSSTYARSLEKVLRIAREKVMQSLEYNTGHEWIGSIQAMQRMLQGEIKIPHEDCDQCDLARKLRRAYEIERKR